MNIKRTITDLGQKNEKAYYLAFLRIAVSLWLLKEMLFRWPALDILYSSNSFLSIDPDPSLSAYGISTAFLKEYYMLIVYTAMTLLLLNMVGIGRNITSFLLFLAFALLFNMNSQFANGGDKMAMLLLFYLAFANTFSHFTLFKRTPFAQHKENIYNLMSNLAAYSIIINLSLIYFIAGLAKLMSPHWQDGTAMHLFLNDDRYSVLAAGGKYVSFPAVILYIINYGTILLELAFPFLVLYKKGRNAALILCLAMHLGVYSFLMVYGMSVIFVIQYGLFFTNEEVVAATGKIRSFLKKR